MPTVCALGLVITNISNTNNTWTYLVWMQTDQGYRKYIGLTSIQ